MPINFRLSRATGLSINSSLPPVTILWNSSTYINNCSISGDSAFVAPVMGLYHFGIGFNGSSSGQGTLEVNIFVNSISVNRKIYSTSILRLSFNIDDNLFLNAGDKVYVTLVTTSGYFSFNGAKDIQFTGYKIN
jgi:hypothetical protein